MALIKCKECHKEISDTVRFCPHCGYKMSKKSNFSKKMLTKIKSNKKIIIILALILIVLIGGLIFYLSYTGSKRYAKKMTSYLEERGFVCERDPYERLVYNCDKKEDGIKEEFKIISYFDTNPFPTSYYEVTINDYTIKIDNYLYSYGVFHGHTNALEVRKDYKVYSFYPDRANIDSFLDAEDFKRDDDKRWFTGDVAKEYCEKTTTFDDDPCSYLDKKVNEALRFYEKVHRNVGLDLESQK